MKSRVALFALLVANFSPAITQSGSISDSVFSKFKVSGSDHLIFSNAKNDVDPSAPTDQSIINEGKVRLELNRFKGDLHFSNKYEVNLADRKPPSLLLEKKSLSYESTDWQLILGDSNQELGRGMALSLFREPTFGIDNTLEGGVAKFRPEDFEVTLFAGRVNVLRTPVAINPIDMRMKDRNVLMASGSLGVKITSDSRMGAHYLMTLNQRKLDLDLDKRFQTAGVTFSQDNIFDSVDFYVESNWMIPDIASRGRWVREPTARAGFASLSWSESPWKIKVEAKDYHNFNFDFRRPPSLEEDAPLANVPNNFSDITAGRLYGEYLISGQSSKVYSWLMYGRDRLENTDLYHAVSGSKVGLSSQSEIEAKAGFRTTMGNSQIYHGTLKGKSKTWPGQMIELELRKQFSRLQLRTIPAEEDRNAIALTYSFSESWNVTGGFEYIPTNDKETGKNFFNLGSSYRSGSLTTRAFIGDTSGGAQCAGGVCRQAPPFSGAMLEATYLF